MKTMDAEMESDDCTMTISIPPKKKKLKQARLPFKTLASSATPNTLLAKKRKHMSPSPTGYRSPKIVKITTKENSQDSKDCPADDEAGEESKNESEDTKNESEDEEQNTSAPSATSSKKLIHSSNNETVTKDKKIETKSPTKPGAITRFLEKVKNPPDAKKDKQPIVLLTRCDISNGENENSECSSSLRRNSDAEEKPSMSKSDESSNEELAKELEDTDDEKSNDDASKEKSDASSDNPVVNSDSDSDRGISSSDDEADEQKKSNDSESGEKTLNGRGLEKTPTSGVKADGVNAAKRRLTPKQLEKKMESTKRREEREKLKQEKEKKLEEDRLLRQKEKEARRREKKEKEEAEKELKRKEKEQKELKKQMEIEQKQKEKDRRDKVKEEDRRKREEAKEEKRKKEEERLEAERKKQKAASTFVSFFVPKKLESKTAEEEKLAPTSNFMPFEVKADMRVAPICRRSLNDSDKSKFDEVCLDKLNGEDNLYITEIKKNGRTIRKSGRTWPPESKDDDVVPIEEDDVGSCNMVDQSNAAVEKQRAKLLAFVENRRPPYWGTWRKRSDAITPRRPFSKDIKLFDYEVDSDEEWEEEEPGESLRGSDDEKDEENPDDDEYDVDNEFMVPHGYLSDEEAQADEDEEDMSPETQKFKLKILGEEFEAERKTQTSKIKPKVIGCIWQGPVNSYPENIPQKLVDFLMARQAWVRETPIMLATRAETDSASASENPGTSGPGEEKRGPKKTQVPDEALPELIRLIHGNPHGRGFLIKEFMTFWNRKNRGNERPLSKSSVNKKICELARHMACPEEGPMHLKACWYVSEETRKAYLGDEELTLPNRWKYALTPKRKTLTEVPEVIEKPEKEDKEKEKKIEPLITQYTKKITQEEMKKQLTVKPSQIPSPRASSSSQSKPPKRATLISVGRGEQFPKSSIKNAFSKIPNTVASKPCGSSTSSPATVDKSSAITPMVIDLESDNSKDIDDDKTENSTTK